MGGGRGSRADECKAARLSNGKDGTAIHQGGEEQVGGDCQERNTRRGKFDVSSGQLRGVLSGRLHTEGRGSEEGP